MDCERFRELLTQDPTIGGAEIDGHARECTSCKAYAARMRASERLIHTAVRFDVNALRGSEPDAPASQNYFGRQFFVGVAAGVAVATLVWSVLTEAPQPDAPTLAQEVAAHWYEEPDSWISTDVQVEDAVLTSALDGKAELDLGQIGTVSYARSCFVAGEWIPHLVVQGDNGPLMVLLLPGHRLQSPVPLRLPEEGLGGRVVPIGEGSIAILGEDDAEVERIRQAMVGAVDWTI